jgi:hypothetical protein
MDEMEYHPDGSIVNRRYWSVEGPTQVGNVNPFKRVEAETMAWSEGIKTHFETQWEGDFTWARGKKIADRLFVTSINHGDYILVQGVDFQNGAKSLEVSAASIYGGQIEFRIGKMDGPVIATVDVNTSRHMGLWKTFSAPVEKVSGVHDLYLVFKGEKELFHLDWWMLK